MKKLNKIRLQNAVVLENSEMKAIYGGSGGDGGSGGSGPCYDGEKLYTCTFYGESGASFSGVVCATSATDAAAKSWEVHGGSGGYTHSSCS